MDVTALKEMLLRKRGEILSGGGRDPLTVTLDTNTRQGDLADQATGNNEVHIQLKLKQTDAKILQAIEEALERILKGTYGICRDCGDPIAEARLHAIPWTRVCITCKAKQSFVTPAELLTLLQEFYRDVARPRAGASGAGAFGHRLQREQRLPAGAGAAGHAPSVAVRRRSSVSAVRCRRRGRRRTTPSLRRAKKRRCSPPRVSAASVSSSSAGRRA